MKKIVLATLLLASSSMVAYAGSEVTWSVTSGGFGGDNGHSPWHLSTVENFVTSDNGWGQDQTKSGTGDAVYVNDKNDKTKTLNDVSVTETHVTGSQSQSLDQSNVTMSVESGGFNADNGHSPWTATSYDNFQSTDGNNGWGSDHTKYGTADVTYTNSKNDKTKVFTDVNVKAEKNTGP